MWATLQPCLHMSHTKGNWQQKCNRYLRTTASPTLLSANDWQVLAQLPSAIQHKRPQLTLLMMRGILRSLSTNILYRDLQEAVHFL